VYADDLAYVHHTGFADLARGAARFLVEHVQGNVADLGCGSGLLARPLVEAGCDVTCVDISPPMLALARKHAKGARFIEASLYDVDGWSPAREPFDAVLAVGEPLSYLAAKTRAPSLARFFRDVARVLRPRGAFVFDVIVAGKPSLTRRSFVEGDGWTTCVSTVDEGARLTRDITTFTRQRSAGWRRGHETHVARVLDVDDVKRDLSRAGFSVRVRKSYGDHPLAIRRRAFLCRLQ
jgi:SAM-dependent methyltransferase